MPDIEGPTPAESEVSARPEAPKSLETNLPREAGTRIFEYYLAAPQPDISFLRQVATPSDEITQADDIPDKLEQALKFRDELRTAFTEEYPDDYPPGQTLEARVAQEIEAIADTTERLRTEKVDQKSDLLDKAKLYDDLNIPLKAAAYRKLAEQYDFVHDTFKDQWLVFSTLGPVEGFDTQEAAIELQDSLQSNFSSSYVMEVDGKFQIFSPSGEIKVFNSQKEAEEYLAGYVLPADTNLIIEKISDSRISTNKPFTQDPKITGFMTNSEYEHRDDPVEIPEGTSEVNPDEMAELMAMLDAMNPRNNAS